MRLPSNRIEILGRGWNAQLARLVRETKSRLLICSPFVTVGGTRIVQENLSKGVAQHGEFQFLTNLSIQNMVQAATDPRAVHSMAVAAQNTTIVHLPGLHAKAFVADDDCAIVTSGNLTNGGLFRDFECGVLIRDEEVVHAIRTDLIAISLLGAVIPTVRLESYCDAFTAIGDTLRSQRKSAESRILRKFKAALKPVDDDLIRLRLGEGSMNTVFAKTIQYLLSVKGPLETTAMHTEVASLHPDLCDDSVDRIIDGKRFGKKWKHAVRSAQQHLKRNEVIHLTDGKWRLKS